MLCNKELLRLFNATKTFKYANRNNIPNNNDTSLTGSNRQSIDSRHITIMNGD